MRLYIVGILACVACPSGHVSGPGAVRCVSCGAVYNSNSAGTACEVRWYVYVGGALAGRCRLSVSNPALKAPMGSALETHI